MIEINLNNLTQAKYDEAKGNMGQCSYSAPCIIGTLVPERKRDELDFAGEDTNIGNLVNEQLVDLPWGQLQDARQMQKAFDDARDDDLFNLVQKYVPDLTP